MRTCPVCASHFPNFLPLPISFFEIFHRLNVPYSLDDFETLNIAQYSCPVCQASDRDRLYALYIHSQFVRTRRSKLRVLDIAPASGLSRILRSLPEVAYRSADLYSALADERVDVMDMRCYPDQSFDFVVCSHVLEHVKDDSVAIAEIYRVLAPDGCAILMVPILTTATMIDEDVELMDVNERWRRFGQDDHVRMYTQSSFLARLERGGFSVVQFGVVDFGAEAFRRHGITPGSILYIGKKELTRE
ncbi:class I SAM-dependent methyltransferase [uncultured Deefgea sp.]|uniref:class I SAM-dependent methyltransferase n=1 Tax=uncultured Deefgea sp. TaxID=1304914 RepID=UPI00261D2548|nr:class I SAM-dependent methyltransferase [uncultured Deefgea sp.]